MNRHLTESARLGLDLRAFPGYRVVEQVVLADDDVRAANTLENQDRVTPRTAQGIGADGVTLPPVSWSLLRLAAADG